ncbi:MAG TPA: hypothetical protein H9737_03690 [Candidatus Borkfalkia faecigallinarum]|uniref:Uncharacterized protein n=1 Tax=Candidatus Borkfalkia faecigallinarum TaxID=2838509 RepID=A0A9D1VTQ3_9FIRM|nr:hypothetical protein [Candidatus Borkfalkia faecigallinarum]
MKKVKYASARAGKRGKRDKNRAGGAKNRAGGTKIARRGGSIFQNAAKGKKRTKDKISFQTEERIIEINFFLC